MSQLIMPSSNKFKTRAFLVGALKSSIVLSYGFKELKAGTVQKSILSYSSREKTEIKRACIS